MKTIFKYILILLPIYGWCQSYEIYKVTYGASYNGKHIGSASLIYKDNMVYYLSEPNVKMLLYTDTKKEENITTVAYNGKIFKHTVPFDKLPQPIESGEKTLEILGYKCKYVKYAYSSNTVEVWYTTKAPAKGSPANTFMPHKKALVLKMIVNDKQKLIAKSIEKVKQPKIVPLPKNVIEITEAELAEIEINLRFTKVQIFNDEIINFDPKIEVPKRKTLKRNHTYRFAKGSLIMKKIKLSEKQKNSPYIFAKLNCRSNGDDYDRTGFCFYHSCKPKIVSIRCMQIWTR